MRHRTDKHTEMNKLNGAMTDSERQYPTPQKDGWKTEYEDEITLTGGWGTRLSKWKKLNLHRIIKGN